ncbi:hypothetical protein [Kordiimonas sp.]|uniref:hypothetical protein n=1 Tax=Kordiimonas sp. TaxID=1970157 RepID=UPI003B51B622
MRNDVGYSLNLSWRIAATIVPGKANELQRQLPEAASNANTCLALWHVRTDWLIEELAQNLFADFFADTIDTLRRKLCSDGQFITAVYVTSANKGYPFDLPEAACNALATREVS